MASPVLPSGLSAAHLSSANFPWRVVFDTNVLLSLWVFIDSPRGSQFAALRAWVDEGKLLPLSGLACFAEFERVLNYPAFKLDVTRQQRALKSYRACLEMLDPAQGPKQGPKQEADWSLPRCSDRDDQKFLELARDGAAQFLLSNDKAVLKLARRKQLVGRFEILSPQVFLQRYGQVLSRSVKT